MATWRVRLGSYDERALNALVLRRRRFLDRVMRLATRAGDGFTTVPIALALLLGVFPDMETPGARAAFALAVSHLVVQLLKRTVVRSRPSPPLGFSFLVEPPDRFSFPSGHAAAGMSLALPLAAALGTPLGIPVLFLGLMVGLSRCYLGIHYPGDVLAGWLLAALSVVAADPLMGLLI